MNIAIIPARGGSKRIPRKNIKNFHGKPIIAYSIAAAKESGCFDRIIVSTDDEEIARVARAYGADVPFLRPANIADDHATTMEVIQHAIKYCTEQGYKPDLVCCIYATAPFLLPAYLQQAKKELNNSKVEYAFSVTSYPFPIQRAVYLTNEGRVQMFYSEYSDTRSQDLKEAYHDAGQFYWGRSSAFSQGKAIFSESSKAVVLPRKRVQDIDTLEDWELAEALFSVL
jgi:N-acylneuraminate cytidylyltransferase